MYMLSLKDVHLLQIQYGQNSFMNPSSELYDKESIQYKSTLKQFQIKISIAQPNLQNTLEV